MMQFSSDDLIIDIRSGKTDETEERKGVREKVFSGSLFSFSLNLGVLMYQLIVCPPISYYVNSD